MVPGVSGAVWMGMWGQVVVKQRGCHESPWLWVLRIRHSQPTKSMLQTLQVAWVRGIRCGRMVWYWRVGRTMERRLRLLVVVVVQVAGVVTWAAGVLAVLGGPGWDASPIRVARRPYRALRRLLVGCGVVCVNGGMVGVWRVSWSPKREVKVGGGCRCACGCGGGGRAVWWRVVQRVAWSGWRCGRVG